MCKVKYSKFQEQTAAKFQSEKKTSSQKYLYGDVTSMVSWA